MTARKLKSERRPKGRPPTRVVRLDATPEQIIRNIFAAAKPPDSKRRIPRRKAKASS